MTDATLSQRLWQLFYINAKISALVVGGGYAILPVIEDEFVRRKKWIKPEDIVDVLAIAQSTPGVIAVNASLFVGYRIAGFAGAMAALFGSILPPFVVIVILAAGLARLGDLPWLERAFSGIRAAICALMLIAAIRLGKQILRSSFDWTVAGMALLGIVVFKLNAVWLIAGGGAIGIVRYLRQRRRGYVPAPRSEDKP